MAVVLSSYDFTESSPPIISTDETMTARYRLRAKFLGVTGYPDGFHAATTFNNNGLRLDTLPPPGDYTVQLYWIQYNDSDGTSTVGPMNDVTVSLHADSAPCPCITLTPGLPGCSACHQPQTLCVCGDQTQQPDNPDQGICFPYRQKITCEAPKAPQAECGETTFTIEAHTGEVPPFSIISILYDEECDEILDESNDPILTIIV